MAIRRMCDMCAHTEASAAGTQVRLKVNSESTVLDLCDEHLAPLMAALKAGTLAEASSPSVVTIPAKTPVFARGPRTLPSDSKAMSVGTPAAMRAWAKEQNLDVPERGPVPTEIVLAYREAH